MPETHFVPRAVPVRAGDSKASGDSFPDAIRVASVIVAVAFVLALGGCVGTADELSAEIAAARNACRQREFKTSVEGARCHNMAEARLGELRGQDAVAIRLQTRLVLAEKVDRGQITEAEAELEFAKANADLNSKATQRLQAQQLIDAQYEAAQAQRRLAQRPVEPSPIFSMTCSTSSPYGGQQQTNCTEDGVRYIRTNPAIRY